LNKYKIITHSMLTVHVSRDL